MPISFELKSKEFLTSGGVQLRYLVAQNNNSSKALLFIHGVGGDATAWKNEQQIAYDNGLNSISIDLRGHGLSDKPPRAEDYAVEKLANDIIELIEYLELSQTIVVGHSFGGVVALSLAQRSHPSIKGVVLISTNHRPLFLTQHISFALSNLLKGIAHILPTGKKRIRPSYEKYIVTHDIHLGRLFSDIHSTSLKSFLLTYSHLFKFDTTQTLSTINVPTMVICGGKDIIFPTKVSKKLVSLIKDAKLVAIPEANHIVVISMPTELMHVILEFEHNTLES